MKYISSDFSLISELANHILIVNLRRKNNKFYILILIRPVLNI